MNVQKMVNDMTNAQFLFVWLVLLSLFIGVVTGIFVGLSLFVLTGQLILLSNTLFWGTIGGVGAALLFGLVFAVAKLVQPLIDKL